MNRPWFAHYESVVPHEIDLQTYQNIGEILDQSFVKFRDRPAFTNMGVTLTYGELKRESEKFASYLQNELGLKKGDRVALMMPNILQYPVALFGILRAGMVAVNVNPLYTARELKHQLNDSGAQTLVVMANAAHLIDKIRDEVTTKHFIVTEIGDLLGFPKRYLVNAVLKYVKKMVPSYKVEGHLSFIDVMKKGDADTFKPEICRHEDTAFLQYTGGTTGVSKGAELTHGNIVANILQASAWLGDFADPGEDIIMTPLPLYHIFSLTANCFVFSSVGALNVLITNPRDLTGFIKEMKKYKFTAFTGVNTLFNGLVNHPDFASVDFSKLKVTLGGGMAVQKAVAQNWKKITGRPLIEAYGLTETSPAACINPMNLKDYNGFIGLPVPSTDVVIKDDQGEDLPIGEVGEICIRGPQVMKGYWNRPEETAKVMTKDGFFRSGDIGVMNSDGYFKIVDRKKDMILVSGFNVFPNEIEDVVSTHPKVFEVAAVGVPNEKSGEAIKLFVVKKDDSLSSDELISFCRENLTGYKVPKLIEFRSELPKSNVGKILRKDLRTEASPN